MYQVQLKLWQPFEKIYKFVSLPDKFESRKQARLFIKAWFESHWHSNNEYQIINGD